MVGMGWMEWMKWDGMDEVDGKGWDGDGRGHLWAIPQWWWG